MENFLASRPSIAKLTVPPKTTANLFASLANRSPGRANGSTAGGTPASSSPGGDANHAHEPQVELIRENGAVQRVVVVCTCGERIELDCVY